MRAALISIAFGIAAYLLGQQVGREALRADMVAAGLIGLDDDEEHPCFSDALEPEPSRLQMQRRQARWQ